MYLIKERERRRDSRMQGRGSRSVMLAGGGGGPEEANVEETRQRGSGSRERSLMEENPAKT